MCSNTSNTFLQAKSDTVVLSTPSPKLASQRVTNHPQGNKQQIVTDKLTASAVSLQNCVNSPKPDDKKLAFLSKFLPRLPLH